MKLVKRKEFEEFIHDRMIIDHPAYHPRNEPRFFYLLSKVPLWVDFKGKTIIPFNTHEGSGQSGTVEDIREEVKGASIEDGIAIQGKTAQEDEKETRDRLEQWLEDMGLFQDW